MDVAEHLVLGVIALEDLVFQDFSRPRVSGIEIERDFTRQFLELGRLPPEDAEKLHEVLESRRLVERDTHVAALVLAQIDAMLARALEDALAVGWLHPNPKSIEEGTVSQVVAFLPEAKGQHFREAVDPPGDRTNVLGAVIDSVHAGHDCEKNLSRTDVARRLVAADVLLSRLEREPERGLPLSVLRDSHDAAGHLARVLLSRGEKRRMRSSRTHRNPEAL